MSTSQPNLCLLFLGLQPYTNYSFVLIACTSAGCASSQPLSGQTLQAAPHGKGESHSYRTAKTWSYRLVFSDGLTRCTTPLSSIKLSCRNLHKRIYFSWSFLYLATFSLLPGTAFLLSFCENFPKFISKFISFINKVRIRGLIFFKAQINMQRLLGI